MDGAVLERGELMMDPRRAHFAGYIPNLFLEGGQMRVLERRHRFRGRHLSSTVGAVAVRRNIFILLLVDKLSLVTRPYFWFLRL
jgi:hypothetical protein